MSLNKQLIIHVATEIIIIGTVTIFLNRRITKLEKALLEQQYKNKELELKLQHIEQVIYSSSRKPFPPQQHHLNQPLQQSQHTQQQQSRSSQPQVFDIPILSGINPLQSIFSTMFEPKQPVVRPTPQKEDNSMNVEILQDEQKEKQNVYVVDDDEKIVEEALNSVLNVEEETQSE